MQRNTSLYVAVFSQDACMMIVTTNGAAATTDAATTIQAAYLSTKG